MKKSVLLISYYFAPQNVIGAVRPTKLAKYLTRMGYDVTVLCAEPLSALRDPLLARDSAEVADVITVRERSLFRWWKTRGEAAKAQKVAAVKASGDSQVMPTAETNADVSAANPAATDHSAVSAPCAPSTASATNEASTAAAPSANPTYAPSLKGRMLNNLYLWLFHQGDKAFARGGLRTLRRRRQHFDLVFSCYGPLSVPLIARRMRQVGLADSWVADFRDEASVPFRWQQPWLSRYLRHIREEADAITVVSDGLLDIMGFTACGQVIQNGYDPDDLQNLTTLALREGVLSFAYCGQLYAGHSDLTPFFKALAGVLAERNETPERVALHYAGAQGADFTVQAARFGLGAAVVDHGMLPREASLALQHAADALLVATWNTAERRGVITGKILEYMMANRPVFCCVSGEIPGSEARALVERTRLGVACEEQTLADDLPGMKAYLHRLFEARFAGAPSPFDPDRQQLERYHYQSIARQMAEVLESAHAKKIHGAKDAL